MDLVEEIENAHLGPNKGPGAARPFGDAGAEYLMKHGGTIEHFAKIGKKTATLPFGETLSTHYLKPPRTIGTL